MSWEEREQDYLRGREDKARSMPALPKIGEGPHLGLPIQIESCGNGNLHGFTFLIAKGGTVLVLHLYR